MKKLIEVLIKNYDRITKKYFFGKKEIDNIKFQEIEDLLKDNNLTLPKTKPNPKMNL